MTRPRYRFTRASLLVLISLLPLSQSIRAEEPQKSAADYIEVIIDEDANCQARDSRHVSVKNNHPTKTIRVWLDRLYRDHYTGDRSRTDLPPMSEPDSLGCATISGGKQEWRVARALFLD